MSGIRRTLMVVNPVSGEGRGSSLRADVQRRLKELFPGDEILTFETTASDHGSGWVRARLTEDASPKRVVVLGGDGTFCEVVQAFFKDGHNVSPDSELGLVPIGKGNDFFKMIAGVGYRRDLEPWERGIEVLSKGAARATDVGQVLLGGGKPGDAGVERYWVNILSFGYSGLVVDRVLNRKGRLGRMFGKSSLTYLVQSTIAMSEYRPLDFSVKVDGKEVYSGPLLSGFVMNGRYNGGGMCWSTRADVCDGFAEVLLLKPRGMLDSMMSSPRMKSGKWDDLEGATLARGSEVEITMLDAAQKSHPVFDVDGDLPERTETSSARVRVLPGALKVFRL